jgi:hypothetical protein
MTGSTAARPFISQRIAAVTRQTWPEIQTLNLWGVIVAAIALVDIDAPGLDGGELLQMCDDGTEGEAITGGSIERLGVEDELAALG